MMEFLVEIHVALPHDLPAEERARVLEEELVRGRELAGDGTIKAIWRLPGALANVAIWEVSDATELHDLISSLPLYRFSTVEVRALAKHPVDR
jgi:muconolactone D-isomerase